MPKQARPPHRTSRETQADDEPGRTGVPPAVPVLAVLGLAALVFCTVPAVASQRRLEADHAQLLRETEAAEQRVRRLKQSLHMGDAPGYLRTKATQELLQRGARYIEERDRKLKRRAARARSRQPVR